MSDPWANAPNMSEQAMEAMRREVAKLKPETVSHGDAAEPLSREVLFARIEQLRAALTDLMARFALDSEEECNDVARRLEIEDVSSLWKAAQKAQAAVDAASV